MFCQRNSRGSDCREWRDQLRQGQGMKTLLGQHFFPHPGLLALALPRRKVGSGTPLPNHNSSSAAEAKSKLYGRQLAKASWGPK